MCQLSLLGPLFIRYTLSSHSESAPWAFSSHSLIRIHDEHWAGLFTCDAVPVLLMRCHARFLQTGKSRPSVSYRGSEVVLATRCFAGTDGRRTTN